MPRKAQTVIKPERRRPGRPTRMTYHLGEQIVEMIRAGAYVEVAAQANGVNRTRLYHWISRAAEYDDATEDELDEVDDETLMFIWFRDTYKQAEAQAEMRLLLNVQMGGPRWQAHMTILQRRFGNRWRESTEIEYTGEVVARPLSPEEQARELKAFGMPSALAMALGPDAIEPPPDA